MSDKDSYIKETKALFHRWAPFYDYLAGFVKPARIIIAREKALAHDAKILDVACGTGIQTIAFAKKGYKVTGIDISPDMLKQAKKKIRSGMKVQFLETDARKMPFQNDFFDLSTISFALHDMPEKMAIEVLTEMKRVTKKGGKIIIAEYNDKKIPLIGWIFHKIVSLWETKYYHHFIKTGLETYLEKAGLKISKKQYGFLRNFQIVTLQV